MLDIWLHDYQETSYQLSFSFSNLYPDFHPQDHIVVARGPLQLQPWCVHSGQPKGGKGNKKECHFVAKSAKSGGITASQCGYMCSRHPMGAKASGPGVPNRQFLPFSADKIKGREMRGGETRKYHWKQSRPTSQRLFPKS